MFTAAVKLRTASTLERDYAQHGKPYASEKLKTICFEHLEPDCLGLGSSWQGVIWRDSMGYIANSDLRSNTARNEAAQARFSSATVLSWIHIRFDNAEVQESSRISSSSRFPKLKLLPGLKGRYAHPTIPKEDC